MVEFLRKLFGWAAAQSRDFRHLPRSYEMMISMLIRARKHRDAESLLLSVEASGALSRANVMFSEIVEGYVEAGELESSVALYNRARDRRSVPSASCYRALLDLLIRMEKAGPALRVYMDMMEVGLGSSSEDRFLDFVVGSLSKEGRILEAVNVLRRARNSGVKASPVALTAIAEGYCKKKDFDDMLNFFEEWEHIPEARVCNKIVSSLCRYLGTEEAWFFVQRMEALGFKPDAITFGIHVGQSCREGKLRSAFIYLSECFARSIKPKVYSYNALISGFFKEGMHWCAKDIFEDMVEKGLTPDLSTFRVLLAGYCKYRKFDEVKRVHDEMINHGAVSLAPAEDALSKAFMILDLDRFGVKVKRDNDVRLPRAEFFDSLGNGLYLETDVEEYEMTLAGILDSALIPDFDSVLNTECQQGDVEAALRLKDEAVQWGQNVSFSTYSKLLKILCASPTHIKKAIDLLDEMPELSDQLDHEILNLLIRILIKNGMMVNTKLILDRLFKRELLVESDSYTSLIMGLCKERNIRGIRECLELAQRSMYRPGSEDIKTLVSCLCKWGMIKEMLELFDNILEKYPDLISAFCSAILKELCLTGFTSVGRILVEEVLQRGVVLDHTAYMNLIEGFIKEQKFAEALAVVDEFLEKKITTCANVYQLLIPSLFRLNRVGKAMSLKQSVLSRQSGAAVSVYSTLVNELCRIGKINEATLELQEMLVNKVFPDDNTLNALIRGYCRENNLGKALEILCIMLRKHVDLSIPGYRSLVRQMSVHGKGLGALRLTVLIQGESESQLLILYNILIFSLFQSKNSLLVESVLNDIQEKHLNPDINTYNFLVYGFYKCGNVSESVNTLNTMITKGLRPSNRSLKTVICCLCSHGELDKALEVSKVMECSGGKYGSMVQNALTRGLLSCGRLCEAELLLDRIEEKDLIPNNINYDFLIKQLCLQGSIPKAIDLLNIMLKKGNLPSEVSYSSVIHGLCLCKSFDQALDFHAEMQHNNLKPSVYSCDALIYGLCVHGRTDDARRFLRLMLQFGPIPTHSMYSYVIDRYYTENNLDKASELLNEMQQVGYSPNFETHWSLISNLSCYDSKEDDDGDGKGFLSHLLSGSEPPAKNHKGKGALTLKYASVTS